MQPAGWGLGERAARRHLRSASTDHQLSWFRMLKNAVMTMNMATQDRLGCSPIEAENGVRPRGVLDFDPNLLGLLYVNLSVNLHNGNRRRGRVVGLF